MASHYTRKGSPYYWLRVRRADGSWDSISSGIRIDQEGSKRKIQQRISDETAKEALMRDDGGSALLRAWVPGYLFVPADQIECWRINGWHGQLWFRVLAPGGVPYRLTDEDMKRMKDVPKRLAEAIEQAKRAEREAREAVQRKGTRVLICQGVLEGMTGTVEGPHKDGVSVDAGLGGRIVVPVDFLRIAA